MRCRRTGCAYRTRRRAAQGDLMGTVRWAAGSPEHCAAGTASWWPALVLARTRAPAPGAPWAAGSPSTGQLAADPTLWRAAAPSHRSISCCPSSRRPPETQFNVEDEDAVEDHLENDQDGIAAAHRAMTPLIDGGSQQGHQHHRPRRPGRARRAPQSSAPPCTAAPQMCWPTSTIPAPLPLFPLLPFRNYFEPRSAGDSLRPNPALRVVRHRGRRARGCLRLILQPRR